MIIMLETELKLRIAMWQKGITGAEVGRRIGVHRVTVHQTIRGKAKGLRVRIALAEAVGLPITDIWPDETRHLSNRLQG
jgi:DNA-binding XRE family transcriptional regulator